MSPPDPDAKDDHQAAPASGNPFRVIELTLDEPVRVHRNADIEHERRVAIYDLIEENHFAPAGSLGGPYRLRLGITENRLAFDVALSDGTSHGKVLLSLTPFRRIVKDYFLMCESYYQAIKTQPPSRIEAIDVGRRGLHDEGSRLLMERLRGKINVDIATARRLFTLLCALHWKG